MMLNKEPNPFTNCRAEIHEKQWCVSSDFWSVPCANEKAAKRICAIIQGAYLAGASDLRSKFNDLLRGEDDW
jgi:hypothetical protein